MCEKGVVFSGGVFFLLNTELVRRIKKLVISLMCSKDVLAALQRVSQHFLILQPCTQKKKKNHAQNVDFK